MLQVFQAVKIAGAFCQHGPGYWIDYFPAVTAAGLLPALH
jgi:hypothetical protein